MSLTNLGALWQRLGLVWELSADSDQTENLTDICSCDRQIKVTAGWLVTDLAGAGDVEPMLDADDNFLYITPDMTATLNNDIYWTAPQEYIGNKVLLVSLLYDM